MKKVLSTFLAIVMVVSMFSMLTTLNVGAATPTPKPTVITTMDFDSNNQPNWKNANTIFKDSKVNTVADGDRGNVAQFNSIRPCDSPQYPRVLPVFAADGETRVQLTKGDIIKVSFKMKRVNCQVQFHVFAHFDAAGNQKLGNYLGESGAEAIRTSPDSVSLAYTWTTTGTSANDSTYKDYSKAFIVPTTGYMNLSVITLATGWGSTTAQDIRLDDIVITKYGHYNENETTNEITKMDFDTCLQPEWKTNNDTFAKSGVTTVNDGVQGNVAKFTTLANYDDTYAQVLPVFDTFGVNRVSVTKGDLIEISFKLKRLTNFELYVCAHVDTTNKLDLSKYMSPYYILGRAPSKDDTMKLQYLYSGTDNDYVTYTKQVIVPSTGTLNLAIVSPVWNGANNGTNKDIRIDDIVIKKLSYVDVTTHSGDKVETKQFVVADPLPAADNIIGAKFDGWYLDANYETKAPDLVTEDMANTDVYAKYSSFINDFDENNVYSFPGSKFFAIEPLVGKDFSSALVRNPSTNNTNNNWPNRFVIKNADGTDVKLNGTDEYVVQFDLKIPDYDKNTSVNAYTSIGLTWLDNSSEMGALYDAVTFDTKDWFLADKTAKSYFNPIYIKNFDAGWQHISFTILPNTANNNKKLVLFVYNVPAEALYIDNIQVSDSALMNKVEADGKVLATGFAGESYVLPETDGTKTFKYWSETEDGDPITAGIFSGNKEIFVARSDVNTFNSNLNADDKLTFKTHFGKLNYTTDGTAVTVDTFEKNGKLYDVTEIGILFAKDFAGEQLTVDAPDVQKFTGSDLRCTPVLDADESVTDEIEIIANVDFGSNYTTEYSIIGYIKLINGEIIYGTQYNGLKQSYAQIKSIESADDLVFTKNGLKLSWNAEFNTDSLAKVKNHGASHFDEDTGVTTYEVFNDSTVKTQGGTLVQTATRVDETTTYMSDLLTGNHFKQGYIEFKAKFGNAAGASMAFWLNSAGISEAEKVYPFADDGDGAYLNPEIDVVEIFDTSSNGYSITTHNWNIYGEENEQNRVANISGIDFSQYHIFGFERTADVMRFYVDGDLKAELKKADALQNLEDGNYPFEYYTVNEINALFENPVYVVLATGIKDDCAVGTSVSSQIDYIRIYE